MFRNADGAKQGNDDDYKRAWLRLCNEETNQTIDYAMMGKIDVAEGYQELIPDGEEEDAPSRLNELVYLMGAIHLEAGAEGKASWVFESYKHAIAGQDFEFKDVGDSLGATYATATKAHNEQ